MAETEFDIIIFGATSFVGQILTRYLVETYGVNGDVRWAIAGRSEAKLEALKKDTGASGVPTILVDAADEAGLSKMATTTRVVISTVGPYALYGEPLVKVCAETGTDYCDLTGEVQWIKRMIDRYEVVAKKSGARIVHSCGFDSIPSDLGVHFLEREALATFGKPAGKVKMGVKAIRGGMSGGTVASMMNVIEEVQRDPSLKKVLQDPYIICGEGHGFSARQRLVRGALHDKDFGRWLAPFIMEGINTRIVHRTNALKGKAYGSDFEYSEAVFSKGRLAATMMSLGLGLFMMFSFLRPTRAFLKKFVVPKPGEGPTPEQQKNGFYDLRFLGQLDTGEEVRAKVTGDRDPGYGSTAKMLAQAGLCLAGLDKTAVEGGMWTPATAMGDALIDRLEKYAGLSFEMLE